MKKEQPIEDTRVEWAIEFDKYLADDCKDSNRMKLFIKRILSEKNKEVQRIIGKEIIYLENSGFEISKLMKIPLVRILKLINNK